MITTAELIELQKLVNGEHKDPHHILGMHSLLFNNVQVLTVRAYIPQAESIEVFDPLQPDIFYPLDKVHNDGFFEGKINGRSKWFRYMLRIESTDGNSWMAYDAYSFYPSLSEMDRYLFREGTHYEIFNKLGAHLCELEGVSGAAFAVWAPGAARVSVVGEFNCWDGRRNQMRNLANSGIWEIFIPGLRELDEYKYEIKTRHGAFIQKCDPYGFYAAQSPGTQSILFDIGKYEWGDRDWVKRPRETAEPVNIYEVHLGSWRRPASYLDAAESMIEYVKEMGYTHIELLPVQEHTSLGSLGYQTTCYYAPTGRYGTPDELMRFIDLCHRAGIGVILDWVPTHFPRDQHALEYFDGSALYERENIRTVWNTNMFDYSRKEVKNFLLGNALFWIEKYHADGLRINNLRHLGVGVSADQGAVEFLKHLNSIIKKRHPETLMIAEDTGELTHITRLVEQGGLGFGMMWNLGWMANLLTYISSDPIRRLNQQSNLEYCLKPDGEINVLPISHDEVAFGKLSILERIPGSDDEKIANLKLALAFMIGCPGAKLIFMGLEFGHRGPWDIVTGLDWGIAADKKHKALQKFVRDLNNFYKSDKPLWSQSEDSCYCGLRLINKRQGILAFERAVDSNFTYFVCNFTKNAYEEYEIDIPLGGSYKEILNSDSKTYGGKSALKQKLSAVKKKDSDGEYQLLIKLPPFSAIIFKPLRKKGKAKR